jgi:hypothetical protein
MNSQNTAITIREKIAGAFFKPKGITLYAPFGYECTLLLVFLYDSELMIS